MSLPAGSICLDAQGAQNRAHFDRGVPRYVVEQLRAVHDAAREAIHSVAVNPSLPLTDNLSWLLGQRLLEWTGPRIARPSRLPRIYHVMSPIELGRPLDEVWPAWARDRKVRTVATVYDLIPLIFDDFYLRDVGLRTRYLARLELLRSIDHLLAISQNTKQDLVERLGVDERRITVIDAGVSVNVQALELEPALAMRLVHERFPEVRREPLLYVAGIEFRKNIERLIDAYGTLPEAVRARHQLVIVCRMLPEERAALRERGRAAGLPDDQLILTGYVTDGELAAFYRTCRLFVFASFYEGSGLPILEAMAAGAPVVASNTSTSPEILGDLEGTFDPMEIADIARCLQRTVGDDELLERLRERSRRRAAHYTWEHVGNQTLLAYERTLAAHRTRRRPRRAVAVHTPWPPERSGIATYNSSLLPELAEHVNVDVIVAGGVEYDEPAHPRIRLITTDALERIGPLLAYDAALYCMGNSHYHGHVYRALRLAPGVVAAHDVRFSGFYGWWSGQERPEDPGSRLVERVRAMYGERLGRGAFADGPPRAEEMAAMGMFMTHEIQEYATRILVHSEHARDVLRLDQPVHRGLATPVDVVPHALREPRSSPQRRVDPAHPVIVSLGILSPAKNLQTLIEAFSLIAANRPGARLVLAGGADEAELERWREAARTAGVADLVQVTGHVSRGDYEELLETATVAVQLRLATNGETSGAVSDCLSAGLPVVVSDIGWFAELPSQAAVKVSRAVSSPSLAAAIASIIDQPQLARAMADSGMRYAADRSFKRVAELYLQALFPAS